MTLHLALMMNHTIWFETRRQKALDVISTERCPNNSFILPNKESSKSNPASTFCKDVLKVVVSIRTWDSMSILSSISLISFHFFSASCLIYNKSLCKSSMFCHVSQACKSKKFNNLHSSDTDSPIIQDLAKTYSLLVFRSSKNCLKGTVGRFLPRR